MKKLLIYLSTIVVFAISTIYLTSCGNHDHDHHESHENHEHSTEEGAGHDNDEDHEHEMVYQCPMKCEGEKTYAETGACPSCGMDLEQIAEAHSHENEEDQDDHEGHDH